MINSLLAIATLITFNIYAGPIESMNEATQAVKDLNSFQNGECAEAPGTVAQITELTKERSVSSFVSSCFKALGKTAPTSFHDAILESISSNKTPITSPLSNGIAKAYHSNKWQSDVALFSNPMCETIDKKLITRNNSEKNKRVDKVSAKMIKIAKHYNKIRQDVLDAVKAKKSQDEIDGLKSRLDDFYAKLMGIIANHESLTTADNKTSKKRGKEFAKYYGVSGYTKPPGVKLYFDTWQTKEESKRNVGLYQFPMSGNIASCITAWNQRYGSKNECKITDKSKKNMFKMLTAPDQLFNAFCGVNKLVQSYGVQVNTDRFEAYKSRIARRTHQDNVIKEGKNKGKLKAPSERCVSLFSHTSNTYNHYGTLGFTTENNTTKLVEEFYDDLGIE